jgi:hypothetical protein
MTDTPQPVTAGETDPMAAAAEAFKVSLGQSDRPRDEQGRFAAKDESAEAAEEIEAEAEAEQAGEAAASDVEPGDGEEAADEAQPEPVAMPSSWAKEDAETWESLSPEAQGKIAEREGQRDAAVNQKFQELANERKGLEPLRAELAQHRDRFIQDADLVLSLVQFQEPPVAMLDPKSQAYNPEQYHLLKAQNEQGEKAIQSLKTQREEALAQRTREIEDAASKAFEEIEGRTRPALLKDVPDIADPQKQATVIREIADYAIKSGIPENVFTDPELAKRVSAGELHIAWKAMQYDRIRAAQGQVKPKAAKAPAPTLRPGNKPSSSAIEHQRLAKDLERVNRTGSIEDGAAIWKHILKQGTP